MQYFKEVLGFSWYEKLKDCLEANIDKLVNLSKLSKEAKLKGTVVPEGRKMFRAFKLCALEDTKVVIVVDFPLADSDGLALSSEDPFIETPLSLHFEGYFEPSLTRWAEQGVLLLNRCLSYTVDEKGEKVAMDWSFLTNKVIEILDNDSSPKLFIFIGNEVEVKNHKVIKVTETLEGLSFEEINNFVKQHYLNAILWN